VSLQGSAGEMFSFIKHSEYFGTVGWFVMVNSRCFCLKILVSRDGILQINYFLLFVLYSETFFRNSDHLLNYK